MTAKVSPAGHALLRAAHGVLALYCPGLYARNHVAVADTNPETVAPSISSALLRMPECHYRIANAAFDRLRDALVAFGSEPSPENDPGL
jgi:hypothetical protein